ncbi:MAG: DUF2341 domain-containing protein [Methylococcaceae bacterium]
MRTISGVRMVYFFAREKIRLNHKEIPNMKFPKYLLLLVLFAIPGLAFSWWNDDWASRKQMTLDGGVTGADLKGGVAEFPLLLRLHTGNFSYFTEVHEGGKDIRMMADDKTPLKYHVEKFDPVNEMALIWVKAPKIRSGVDSDTLWMYYNNDEAQDASDSKGVYDVNQALVFHFEEQNPQPVDATAYANNANKSTATVEPAGWIGAAAKFSGSSLIEVPVSPSLQLDPVKGYSFSAWVKLDQPATESYVFRAVDGNKSLELIARNSNLVARYVGDKSAETPAYTIPVLGQWHNVSVVVGGGKLDLYVDGNLAGTVNATVTAMNPRLTFGGDEAKGGYFNGVLDEVLVSNASRDPDWYKLIARSQSPDFNVVNVGADEGKQGGGGGVNSFVVIIQNVTIDGWVVIGLTGIMFVVALIVMITKAMVISRVKKDNKAFMEQYDAMGPDTDPTSLDQEETAEEKELGDSEFLTAMMGSHDHFQSSPIYKIYHAGIREVKKRMGNGAASRGMSPEALDVLRVKLDSVVVREGQRLNSNMVLLTIAIAGGPFLGLLGTVVGVMITFAVIAATGDVNINAIAPGIAAALLATVAGLAVAIPALFAYNYLLTQIKDIVADMRVFTDEFMAMVTEKIADRQRNM